MNPRHDPPEETQRTDDRRVLPEQIAVSGKFASNCVVCQFKTRDFKQKCRLIELYIRVLIVKILPKSVDSSVKPVAGIRLLLHPENSAVPHLVELFRRLFQSAVRLIIDGIGIERGGVEPAEDHRLEPGTDPLDQRLRKRVQIGQRRAGQRITVLPEIKDGALLPAAHVDDFHQPVRFGTGLRNVHDEVQIFRRGPCRHDQAQQFLQLCFRDVFADVGAATPASLQNAVADEPSHGLAHRHVAYAELFRQIALGGQRCAPGKIADLNLFAKTLFGDLNFCQSFPLQFHIQKWCPVF